MKVLVYYAIHMLYFHFTWFTGNSLEADFLNVLPIHHAHELELSRHEHSDLHFILAIIIHNKWTTKVYYNNKNLVHVLLLTYVTYICKLRMTIIEILIHSAPFDNKRDFDSSERQKSGRISNWIDAHGNMEGTAIQ